MISTETLRLEAEYNCKEHENEVKKMYKFKRDKYIYTEHQREIRKRPDPARNHFAATRKKKKPRRKKPDKTPGYKKRRRKKGFEIKHHLTSEMKLDITTN